jgi:hypothetical protein
VKYALVYGFDGNPISRIEPYDTRESARAAYDPERRIRWAGRVSGVDVVELERDGSPARRLETLVEDEPIHPQPGYKIHDGVTDWQECDTCHLRTGKGIATEWDATYFADGWDPDRCPRCGAGLMSLPDEEDDEEDDEGEWPEDPWHDGEPWRGGRDG